MTEPAATPAAPATPSGSTPTLVTQTQPTGYQPSTPPAQPASAAPAAETPPNPAIQQPVVENPPAPSPNPAPSPAPIAAKEGEPPVPSTDTFKLPDEYKDKPWAAKVKNQDDLYKQIDNLTTLVGKKAVVPDLKTATAEDREAFYSQLRGKDATEYPIPANPAFPTPPETQPAVAKLFMDNGVSPVQAEAIIKGYQELGAKQLAEQFDPNGFTKSMETAFGAEWKETTGKVRNTLKGMMNADDNKALDAVPNNLLGVVYRTLGNIVKAYGIKETDSAHFGPGGKAAVTDVNSVRQGLRDQLASLSMRPHTTGEQQAIIDKLNDTYTNDPRLQQA